MSGRVGFTVDVLVSLVWLAKNVRFKGKSVGRTSGGGRRIGFVYRGPLFDLCFFVEVFLADFVALAVEFQFGSDSTGVAK